MPCVCYVSSLCGTKTRAVVLMGACGMGIIGRGSASEGRHRPGFSFFVFRFFFRCSLAEWCVMPCHAMVVRSIRHGILALCMAMAVGSIRHGVLTLVMRYTLMRYAAAAVAEYRVNALITRRAVGRDRFPI